MELIRDNWNDSNYNEFMKFLFDNRDIKYSKFHKGLGIESKVIGIKTPMLKRIAKEISKGNYREFLKILGKTYYEEITLYGFIVCNIKDLDESIKYLDAFKTIINNWASCDLFCSEYKIVGKNKDYFWKYINDNIGSSNLWVKRLCFVLILSYYIEEQRLSDIFALTDEYGTNDYYVQMAVSWLISICYIKFPKITINYITNNKLDKFTHNKAIQKIRESYRVSIEDKEYLNKLKRK